MKPPTVYFIDATTNETPKPFVRTKTADAILASIARFAQRTPVDLQMESAQVTGDSPNVRRGSVRSSM